MWLAVASLLVHTRSLAAAQVNTGCIFSWHPSAEIALEQLFKLVSALLGDGGRAIALVGDILHASTSASSGGMHK